MKPCRIQTTPGVDQERYETPARPTSHCNQKDRLERLLGGILSLKDGGAGQIWGNGGGGKGHHSERLTSGCGSIRNLFQGTLFRAVPPANFKQIGRHSCQGAQKQVCEEIGLQKSRAGSKE